LINGNILILQIFRYHLFSKHTFNSKFIELSKDFLDFLNEDSILIPNLDDYEENEVKYNKFLLEDNEEISEFEKNEEKNIEINKKTLDYKLDDILNNNLINEKEDNETKLKNCSEILIFIKNTISEFGYGKFKFKLKYFQN
jgi:hypothetical protein